MKRERTKIIAEIGSNHLGDMELAQKMIKVAAQNGIDIVKFQSWQAKTLIKTYPDYEAKRTWYQKTELDEQKHQFLKEACAKAGVEFLTTVFDLGQVDFLARLTPERIKIASPDCSSLSLLKAVKSKFKEVIVSTGMTYDAEVIETARLLKDSNFVFMHCVSMYPTPLEQANLSRMEWLKQFTPRVGFSDHSLGVELAKMAVVLGACYVEKHFTIDRNLPGPDQKMSTLPEDFAELARYRDECEKAWGVSNRPLTDSEENLRKIYIGKWGNNK
ncbi:MAG: N-acetylneuraminate synthase family protein [Candidatus Omnitrophica bacterium]|nr:N-acetylneuraminate synthase family protein [Candidatus Omnitrophota bacterium]